MMTLRLLIVLSIAVCFKVHMVVAVTDRIRLESCDSNDRRIIAAHISSDSIRGKLECYFEPKSSQYSFRIKINKLNLARQNGDCPSVKFIGFTTKEKLPETEEDGRQMPDRNILVPADPEDLKKYDCNNYESASGVIFETGKIGQNILLVYDTASTREARTEDLDFIMTSFLPGPSDNCPKEHFQCWNSRHVCIDKTVECDNIDNCYDNSDEDNYRCSGKILGLYLPMFIILLILILILVIGFIIGVVLCCRRRRNKIAKGSHSNVAQVFHTSQARY